MRPPLPCLRSGPLRAAWRSLEDGARHRPLFQERKTAEQYLRNAVEAVGDLLPVLQSNRSGAGHDDDAQPRADGKQNDGGGLAFPLTDRPRSRGPCPCRVRRWNTMGLRDMTHITLGRMDVVRQAVCGFRRQPGESFLRQMLPAASSQKPIASSFERGSHGCSKP